jgi:hypothetical protein
LTNSSDISKNENRFYPNPVDDILHSTGYIERLEVIDLAGKVVKSFTNSDRFDLTGLPAGVYCVRHEGGSHIFLKYEKK